MQLKKPVCWHVCKKSDLFFSSTFLSIRRRFGLWFLFLFDFFFGLWLSLWSYPPTGSKDNLVIYHVSFDCVAFLELTGNNIVRKRVLEQLLDRTAQGAGAIFWIVAFFDHFFLNGIRDLQLNFAVQDLFLQVGDDDPRDLLELGFA